MASQLEVGRGRNLWQYWIAGKGLARWADSPTPYRTLVEQLGSEGVPAGQIHGLAANVYHRVFGTWPGKHDRPGGHPSAGEMVAAKIAISKGQ